MSTQPMMSVADLDAYLSGDKETRLKQVTGAVRSYCGWHISPSVAESVTIYGNGSDKLFLPTLHVTSVASVSVDGDDPLSVDDFRWSPQGVLSGRTWPVDKPVVVSFTHGYDEASDVMGVIAELVSARTSYPSGQTPAAVSLGSARVSFTGAGGAPIRAMASEPQMAVLDRYKVPSRP